MERESLRTWFRRGKLWQRLEDGAAHDFDAPRADLVERVLSGVAVIVQPARASILEVDQIDGGNADVQRRSMIVQDVAGLIRKITSIPQLLRGIEDGLHQCRRAARRH